ncbi:hypothetical protein M378DRAFT_17786 [Amanita muscaria Koide BX008]|uniref:Uncharacterized protein n=1 Tax=Amanita muscaria (strain Koide BX008) TaxID=946122 RepID=A0A0C2RZ22_AMAMK|nr:hypothetical protein M378DRAFT_17786 [Amanita muscaria Koide BX008]
MLKPVTDGFEFILKSEDEVFRKFDGREMRIAPKVICDDELFTLSHAFQQDVTRNPSGIPACYKDFTGIPGKFLVVNLAGNTAKNYQESTKTPEGCYQEFLVKCKDVRGNYQDSLYLD